MMKRHTLIRDMKGASGESGYLTVKTQKEKQRSDMEQTLSVGSIQTPQYIQDDENRIEKLFEREDASSATLRKKSGPMSPLKQRRISDAESQLYPSRKQDSVERDSSQKSQSLNPPSMSKRKSIIKNQPWMIKVQRPNSSSSSSSSVRSKRAPSKKGRRRKYKGYKKKKNKEEQAKPIPIPLTEEEQRELLED